MTTTGHGRVLRLLADGERHSGEQIAAELGISRSAVAKAVRRAADDLGLVIEARRGQGYRLAEPLELLDAQRILAGLPSQSLALLTGLEVLESVDSTNSHLLRLAGQGVVGGRVCLAERQSAGRGRLGRAWVSPFGANLYLSLLWRSPLALSQLGGLSLAAGVAVARALEAVGAEGIALKWPNDLHWQRRKLAGLLLEASGESQGPSTLVLGVGINLRMPPEQAADIDQPWSDLSMLPRVDHLARNRLASALIQALFEALSMFEQAGFEAFLDDWSERDAYRGERVSLQIGTSRIQGRYLGIDAEGCLLLETDEGQRRFQSGEVSLRVLGWRDGAEKRT